MSRAGCVYLVGAGPGDPGLVTMRMLEILAEADVILYDRLVNPGLLLHAPARALRIPVGKGGGMESTRQASINRRMIREARKGRIVVRLKGGDPFLFARGAEEAIALAKARVRFEIVPGISAALAVPSCAGIPLTMRGASSSVTIVTGHEAPGSEAGVDWERLLRADSTFVMLMAVGNLGEIVRRFLAAGKDPATPAALVENGCTPLQRTVAGPLRRIASLARSRGVAAPAVLIVGRTVGLRRRLARRRRLPLAGARVLVTRPADQALKTKRMLEERGAWPILCPLIEIRPPRSYRPLDRELRRLCRYDWIVFTSVNGVRSFMLRLRVLGLDSRAVASSRVCAVGPATEEELERWGLIADLRPVEFTTSSIARALAAQGEISGRTFLLPRSSAAGGELPAALRGSGGRCVEVTAYTTVRLTEEARNLRAGLERGEIDIVMLTSPSVAEVYAGVVKGLSKARVRLPVCAAIGPVTAEAARARGLTLHIEAAEHTDEGLVVALERFWRKREGRMPSGR